MKYEQLTEKYGTDKIDDVPVEMYSQYEKSKMSTMKLKLHSAKLGDFIKDYIEHTNISKWRRSFDWDIIEEQIRKHLNQATVQWHQ